jgi:hypothetical protein
VGLEGDVKQRAKAYDFEGSWARSLEHINQLIEDLAQPTTEVVRVIGAVAQGTIMFVI